MALKLSRRRLAAICAVFGLTAVLALAGVASAQMAARSWKVWAGWVATETGNPPTAPTEIALSANRYYPSMLEINVGDTVEFTATGPHTVTIGRERMLPFDLTTGQPIPELAFPRGGNTYNGTDVVQSGILEPGQTFRVTFATPGDIRVLCDIHHQHEMTVRVRPAGQPVAMSPEQAGQTGLMAAFSDVANQGVSLILRESRVRTGLRDGTVLREVSAGFGNGLIEGLRFLPQDIVVREGDWVRWINPDPEAPHTVTLFPGGGLPDPSMPPPPDFSPFMNTPDTMYTGENLVNLALSADPMMQQQLGLADRGEIQFTTPGDYTYVCVIHLEVGMIGKVTVLPR